MSQDFADIPLPKAWPERARGALVQVMALANVAIVCARGKAANTPLAATRLRTKLENARAEIALLREEAKNCGSRTLVWLRRTLVDGRTTGPPTGCPFWS